MFSGRIIDERWSFTPFEFPEGAWFLELEASHDNQDDIFFLARPSEVESMIACGELLSVNKFTDTTPDYRSNLKIVNAKGGFSSYQAEYPFLMMKKLSSLYTDCSPLTSSRCERVGVFLRNIYSKPLISERKVYLYNNEMQKIIAEFKVLLNSTNFLDLTRFKSDLKNSFLYGVDFIGVPIYFIEYESGAISMEHTHPPHELIGGSDRFGLVQRLKERLGEKISKAFVSQRLG